ncbi:MAG: hypothetical protein DWH84_04295 [Planctomycetota bacterium]|nr:MAG: hypothetical protein DWH84_04295 [Planctomycetota bacterium]
MIQIEKFGTAPYEFAPGGYRADEQELAAITDSAQPRSHPEQPRRVRRHETRKPRHHDRRADARPHQENSRHRDLLGARLESARPSKPDGQAKVPLLSVLRLPVRLQSAIQQRLRLA